MGVFLSGYDPIKMLEALINRLIQKGVLTKVEAENIVASAKDPSM